MTPPADSQPTMMWSTISSLRQLLRFNRGAVEVQEHGEFDHALIEDPVSRRYNKSFAAI